MFVGANDWEAQGNYIRKQFLSRANGLDVLTHFVCATDTDLSRVIWTSTRDILLKKTLVTGLSSMM